MYQYVITSAEKYVPEIAGSAATRDEVNEIVRKIVPDAHGAQSILAKDRPMQGSVLDWDLNVIGWWKLTEASL